MNHSPGQPYPQVLQVDPGGPWTSRMDLGPPPRWTFPPAVVARKKRGRGEVACTVVVLVLVLLVMLGALVLGAFRMQRLQDELVQLRQDMKARCEAPTLQRQIGLQETAVEKKEARPAAHLTGRVEKDNPSRTLRWEPKHGQAFTSGVEYRDGGIRINQTGLYLVYSRVEFLIRQCSPKDSLSHVVFKRGEGARPQVLLEGEREGYCHSAGGAGGLWSASSYLGAVFHLTRQDLLFVNVSHPAQLTHAHNANYFGLSKL